MCCEGKLTVYFEDPFWIGIYERRTGNNLEVARILFGAEPKDYDVYAYLLDNWEGLRFSPCVAAEKPESKVYNPKRMQRETKKQVDAKGTGTKSQMALAMLHEQNAVARKLNRHLRKKEEEQEKFIMRQQKKKEKHRGR